MAIRVVVVGLGEVGQPLRALIAEHHETIGVDVALPADPIGKVDVMHICYPYQVEGFERETARYIELFRPGMTIINSTVAVGTTRKIGEATGSVVVHSPIRGKHANMANDMRRYSKFVGAMEEVSAGCAAEHFRSVGLRVNILSSPEATELAKLTETTYFGVLIAWAQELERLCDQTGQSYDEIISFYDEIGFFPPVRYFPGVIGGHCVIPNLKILRELNPGIMLECIEVSNEAKKARDDDTERRCDMAMSV